MASRFRTVNTHWHLDHTWGIESTLKHEPTPGDGIRAFLVSSSSGILQSETVHQREVELAASAVTVSKGDTIDFVVDIGDVLNSDQYLWSATITVVESDQPTIEWDSVKDFPSEQVKQLDGWQQLAQVLLSTNEFLFVD